MNNGLKDKYKPPGQLNKVGKDTWFRVWSILEKEGKAEHNDPIAVEMVAYNYQMYKQMATQIKKDGLVLEHTNQAGATNKTKHHLIPEIPKIMTQLRSYIGELGLTGLSRKKLQEKLEGDIDDDLDNI